MRGVPIMMNFIRRNTKYFLWGLATVFIIGVFFWNFSFKQYDYVAKVGRTKIPYLTFRNIYERELTNARDRMDEELTESVKSSIKQDVLRRLIFNAIFIKEAKRYKIRVSPGEIASVLHSQPEFQHEGAFSRRKYYTVLNYMHIAPSTYEEQIKQELLIGKLNRLITSGIVLNDLEITEVYEFRNNGDMSKFEEERDSFGESLLEEKRLILFNEWLQNIRNRYKVEVRLNEIEKQIARFSEEE